MSSELTLLAIVVVLLALTVSGIVRDRRRMRNAVLLGLTFIFCGLWLLVATTRASESVGQGVSLLILLGFPLFLLVLTGYLVASCVTMLRRERFRLVTFLPLGALCGLFGLVIGWARLASAMTAEEAEPPYRAPDSLRIPFLALSSAMLVAFYIAFVFTCFVLYSFVQGRIRHRRGMAAIVVHGAGLIGDRIPPLLASRLDRSIQIYRDEIAEGRTPLVIPSGGQGPDETISEAEAMARYLAERGVAPEHIAPEGRSTTTRENLAFSKKVMEQRCGGGRMVLVTNNFHALRTGIISRSLGIQAEVVGSPTARYYLPNAVLREFVAILVHYRYLNLALCLAFAAIPFLLALDTV